MSNISANSLFHFTKSFENLIGILREGFIPNYRPEVYTFSTKQDRYDMYVPMTCFCDLPLSQVKNHIETYGGYGIGMTKKWGVSKGLNPVVYLNKGSQLSSDITEIGNLLLDNCVTIDFLNSKEIIKKANSLRSFIKPYEDNVAENNRYYDEREWRYVPEKLTVLTTKQYTSIGEEEWRKMLIDNSLSLENEEVKYLIVKEHAEIFPIIQHLQSIMRDRLSDEQITILSSKVMTSEDIMNDF